MSNISAPASNNNIQSPTQDANNVVNNPQNLDHAGLAEQVRATGNRRNSQRSLTKYNQNSTNLSDTANITGGEYRIHEFRRQYKDQGGNDSEFSNSDIHTLFSAEDREEAISQLGLSDKVSSDEVDQLIKSIIQDQEDLLTLSELVDYIEPISTDINPDTELPNISGRGFSLREGDLISLQEKGLITIDQEGHIHITQFGKDSADSLQIKHEVSTELSDEDNLLNTVFNNYDHRNFWGRSGTITGPEYVNYHVNQYSELHKAALESEDPRIAQAALEEFEVARSQIESDSLTLVRLAKYHKTFSPDGNTKSESIFNYHDKNGDGLDINDIDKIQLSSVNKSDIRYLYNEGYINISSSGEIQIEEAGNQFIDSFKFNELTGVPKLALAAIERYDGSFYSIKGSGISPSAVRHVEINDYINDHREALDRGDSRALNKLEDFKNAQSKDAGDLSILSSYYQRVVLKAERSGISITEQEAILDKQGNGLSFSDFKGISTTMDERTLIHLHKKGYIELEPSGKISLTRLGHTTASDYYNPPPSQEVQNALAALDQYNNPSLWESFLGESISPRDYWFTRVKEYEVANKDALEAGSPQALAAFETAKTHISKETNELFLLAKYQKNVLTNNNDPASINDALNSLDKNGDGFDKRDLVNSRRVSGLRVRNLVDLQNSGLITIKNGEIIIEDKGRSILNDLPDAQAEDDFQNNAWVALDLYSTPVNGVAAFNQNSYYALHNNEINETYYDAVNAGNPNAEGDRDRAQAKLSENTNKLFMITNYYVSVVEESGEKSIDELEAQLDLDGQGIDRSDLLINRRPSSLKLDEDRLIGLQKEGYISIDSDTGDFTILSKGQRLVNRLEGNVSDERLNLEKTLDYYNLSHASQNERINYRDIHSAEISHLKQGDRTSSAVSNAKEKAWELMVLGNFYDNVINDFSSVTADNQINQDDLPNPSKYRGLTLETLYELDDKGYITFNDDGRIDITREGKGIIEIVDPNSLSL